MKTISESGTISNEGKLRMPMDRVNAFLMSNKGKRVIVRIDAAEPGMTAAQMAYYTNYILPEVQKAMAETGERMSVERVEEFLLSEYPFTPCRDDGSMITSVRQMTGPQMSEFITWLQQYAAENLYIYIEDAQ